MDGRVLIIEDDDAIANIIGTYLKKEGFQIERVDNGAILENYEVPYQKKAQR
ncbi:hypothetical protein [Neobacillus vireti]|uniref:hypothetical protein n=1 Tax=Neobacillus vireti TaxID=220686 RepID=UPI002FFD60C3